MCQPHRAVVALQLPRGATGFRDNPAQRQSSCAPIWQKALRYGAPGIAATSVATSPAAGKRSSWCLLNTRAPSTSISNTPRPPTTRSTTTAVPKRSASSAAAREA